MRVFTGLDNLKPFRNPVVTVGSYDGVHLGHRVILDAIKSEAERINGEAVVVTFSPHPREVIEGAGVVSLLNTQAEKELLLSRAGIDNLIIIPFTKDFSRTSPKDFVEKILVDKIGVTLLATGYNHHFGYGKTGDPELLKGLANEYGFGIMKVEKQTFGDLKASSTNIRNLILSGNISAASHLLGYNYFVSGEIRSLCMEVPSYKLMPPDGIYSFSINVWPREHGVDVPVAGGPSFCQNVSKGHSASDVILRGIVKDHRISLSDEREFREGEKVAISFIE